MRSEVQCKWCTCVDVPVEGEIEVGVWNCPNCWNPVDEPPMIKQRTRRKPAFKRIITHTPKEPRLYHEVHIKRAIG